MIWSVLKQQGKTRLIVLIVVLVLLAVPALWFLLRPKSQPSPDAGKAVAEAFLGQIREGKPEAAWESTTAEFKSAKGRDAFLRIVKTAPFLSQPLDFVSLQTVSVNDQPRSEYLFRSKEGKTVRLILNREARIWKVDHWNPSL